MPSLSRRRDEDGRRERLESEVRSQDMQAKDFAAKRKFQCIRCGHMYEERSRYCPRCDTHTMGELRPIDSQHIEEARRNALRRAKGRL